MVFSSLETIGKNYMNNLVTKIRVCDHKNYLPEKSNWYILERD